jgi:hypothetical protein
VNSPNHPLDSRLEGYYQGLVPWVPRAAGYGLTNLDTVKFPLAANNWGTKHSILDMVPPLLAKGGTTNLKELNLGMTCTSLFIPP